MDRIQLKQGSPKGCIGTAMWKHLFLWNASKDIVGIKGVRGWLSEPFQERLIVQHYIIFFMDLALLLPCCITHSNGCSFIVSGGEEEYFYDIWWDAHYLIFSFPIFLFNTIHTFSTADKITVQLPSQSKHPKVLFTKLSPGGV